MALVTGTSFRELHDACAVHGFRVLLELVDLTGHRVRDWEGAGEALLRLRVLDHQGDVVAGRCQSDPGHELVDELADGVAATMRRKGLMA